MSNEPLAKMMLMTAIVGMSEDDAKGTVVGNGYKFRITRINGNPMICTQDYNPKRVNVRLVNGVVDEAFAG